MPKIVDHDAYRAELAQRAIPVFRKLGYHGLGMRRIAQELGVSKSALYHYFPSKQALFNACSQQLTHIPTPELTSQAGPEERFGALLALAHKLDEDFRGELSLLLDYTRHMSHEEIMAQNPMKDSESALYQCMNALVGEERAQSALHQLLGILLLRAFNGGQTGFESMRPFFFGTHAP